MATSNVRAFDLALKRYGDEHIPRKMRDRMTVVALEGTKSLVEKTPRDRGYAKGNWQVTTGEPAAGEVERLDPTPAGSAANSPSMAEAEGVLSEWRPGDMVWWHNGIPYIRVLEDGTESRPANHMLQRTITHLRSWLRPS